MPASVRVPAGAGREQRSGGGGGRADTSGGETRRRRPRAAGGRPPPPRPLAASASLGAASLPAAERAAPAKGPRSPGRTRLGGSLPPLARPVLPAAGGEDGGRSPLPHPSRRRSLAGQSERGKERSEARDVRAGRRRGTGQSRPAAVERRERARVPVSRETGSAVAAAREREEEGKREQLRSGPGSLPAAAREGPAAGVGRRASAGAAAGPAPGAPASRSPGAAAVAPALPLPRVGAAREPGRPGFGGARAPAGRGDGRTDGMARRRVAATWLILPVAYACLKA